MESQSKIKIKIDMLIQYFQENKTQMLRYGIVGATGAVVDLVALYFLTEFVGWHYLLSATLAFIFSALLNFYLNRVWTFRVLADPKKQLVIFAFVSVSGLLLNNCILYALVEWLGFYYMYSKVVAIALVTIWNFLWNKYLTFKK